MGLDWLGGGRTLVSTIYTHQNCRVIRNRLTHFNRKANTNFLGAKPT